MEQGQDRRSEGIAQAEGHLDASSSPTYGLPGPRARALQLLLGHTKLESTVRYLGIEVDDALEMAEQTEV